MARLVELDGGAGMVGVLRRADGTQHRFTGVQILGVLGAHEVKVESGKCCDDPVNGFCFRADTGRKFGQDAAHLVTFGQLQFVPAVVQFNHCQGFHKESGTGGGRIMHDGLQFAFELGAQRDDVTPIALGDDGFLQDGLVRGISNDAFEPREQAVVRDLDL